MSGAWPLPALASKCFLSNWHQHPTVPTISHRPATFPPTLPPTSALPCCGSDDTAVVPYVLTHSLCEWGDSATYWLLGGIPQTPCNSRNTVLIGRNKPSAFVFLNSILRRRYRLLGSAPIRWKHNKELWIHQWQMLQTARILQRQVVICVSFRAVTRHSFVRSIWPGTKGHMRHRDLLFAMFASVASLESSSFMLLPTTFYPCLPYSGIISLQFP
jgi:hypothetical protein